MAMATTGLITDKVYEVIRAMKETGLWQKNPPLWVSEYHERTIATKNDFSEWLQFVYLPNLSQQADDNNRFLQKNLIVPQALKFFGDDLQKGRLLQLLIELDALL